MTATYEVHLSKLDGEMLHSNFGIQPKQLNFLKIRQGNVEKNSSHQKKIKAKLLLWQQWAMTTIHLFLITYILIFF